MTAISTPPVLRRRWRLGSLPRAVVPHAPRFGQLFVHAIISAYSRQFELLTSSAAAVVALIMFAILTGFTLIILGLLRVKKGAVIRSLKPHCAMSASPAAYWSPVFVCTWVLAPKISCYLIPCRRRQQFMPFPSQYPQLRFGGANLLCAIP